MFWLGFAVGLMVGGNVGVLVMACLKIKKLGCVTEND